jgi:hypothetical protein
VSVVVRRKRLPEPQDVLGRHDVGPNVEIRLTAVLAAPPLGDENLGEAREHAIARAPDVHHSRDDCRFPRRARTKVLRTEQNLALCATSLRDVEPDDVVDDVPVSSHRSRRPFGHRRIASVTWTPQASPTSFCRIRSRTTSDSVTSGVTSPLRWFGLGTTAEFTARLTRSSWTAPGIGSRLQAHDWCSSGS